MITNFIMQSSNNLHLLLALSFAAQNLKRYVNAYRHHESERLRVNRSHHIVSFPLPFSSY